MSFGIVKSLAAPNACSSNFESFVWRELELEISAYYVTDVKKYLNDDIQKLLEMELLEMELTCTMNSQNGCPALPGVCKNW